MQTERERVFMIVQNTYQESYLKTFHILSLKVFFYYYLSHSLSVFSFIFQLVMLMRTDHVLHHHARMVENVVISVIQNLFVSVQLVTVVKSVNIIRVSSELIR